MRITLAVSLFFFVASAVASDAAMTLTVSGTDITARGVTPNGEVVLFGRTHQYVGGTPHLGWHATIERDADGDGVVTLTVESLPLHSVWVAVDHTAGSHAVARPAGLELELIELAHDQWRDGAATVELSRDYLDFLVVRPGKGAWRGAIFQGGADDDDGMSNALLRARVEGMQQLAGKEKAPPRASKKDVLAIIDPRTLDVFVKAAE